MKKYVVMLLLLLPTVLAAEELFMVRSQLAFPEAMTVLQQTIRENGYQVSRVQRIDIGLTSKLRESGFLAAIVSRARLRAAT